MENFAKNRRIAMEWWMNLLPETRATISNNEYSRPWNTLTGREIQSLYDQFSNLSK